MEPDFVDDDHQMEEISPKIQVTESYGFEPRYIETKADQFLNKWQTLNTNVKTTLQKYKYQQPHVEDDLEDISLEDSYKISGGGDDRQMLMAMMKNNPHNRSISSFKSRLFSSFTNDVILEEDEQESARRLSRQPVH